MGITAFPFSSVIDVPTARILGRDDAGTGSAEALTNTEIFAILGTGTPSASTYLRGDGTWATVSAGVGGSTGSVDNAVLRADGTGGATLQASSIIIADNYTSSPNATVNHASIQATGATTNVSVSIVPKGSGAFSLAVPDGTATGGNVRGANAVDLQTSRNAASQVASGAQSFAVGNNCTASGAQSFAVGNNCTASGAQSFAVGNNCTASGQHAVALGYSSLASGTGAPLALGYGASATADGSIAIGRNAMSNRQQQFSFSGAGFGGANGIAQFTMFVLRATTNGIVPQTLFTGWNQDSRLTIPSGMLLHATVTILGSKSGGSVAASYMRQVCIKNVGGTTSLVGTVNTIGTDEAAGTSIAITADNTNDALQIDVTGVASETWRWVALVYGVELAYGT